jgi:cupin 2 domain-containing protein
MSPPTFNLLSAMPPPAAEEEFRELLRGGAFRLERIVSQGHGTPPGQWYDQPHEEWVLLLAGRAQLLLEGEAAPRELFAGDCVLLKQHVRHRVEATDPALPTVWLALHYVAQQDQAAV